MLRKIKKLIASIRKNRKLQHDTKNKKAYSFYPQKQKATS